MLLCNPCKLQQYILNINGGSRGSYGAISPFKQNQKDDMPLIRYRTGDRVRRVDTDEGAPLEFPWLAASEVAGRDQEFLLSSTGRRISLTAFNMHDQIFDDLYAVQFFQEAAGRAEFRFVPGPRFQRTRLPAIEAGIRRKLGEDFQLTLREVRETEKSARGKHRWLVSQVAGQVKP